MVAAKAFGLIKSTVGGFQKDRGRAAGEGEVHCSPYADSSDGAE